MTNATRIELERRIIRQLIRHFGARFWSPVKVYDGGDEAEAVTGERATLEAVFAVDTSRVYFSNGIALRSVLLIAGNGEDIVSDWSYAEGDADGFDAAMDSFLDSLAS